MKNYLLLLLLALSVVRIQAQQGVGIGTAAPHGKAILELSSTTKGLLIPRMSSTDRTGIMTPPQGLMVFQNTGTTSLGFWYHDGTSWQRFAKASELTGSSSWTISGLNQYSNVDGNVGIGTMTPTSKLHLAGNLLLDNGTITMNRPNGILQFQDAGVNKAYVQLSGSNLRLGTNSGNSGGNFIVRMNGEEYLSIDSTGNVGIGTTAPTSLLHVFGGTIKVDRPGVNLFTMAPLTPIVSFEMTNENNKSAGLYFTNSGSELANLYYTNKTSGPDFFRFGVSDPDAFDMMINDLGRVGINMVGSTPEPTGQLHVRGAPGVDDIVVQKAEIGGNPTIQFYNSFAGSGMPGDKRAYMQLSDNYDLRMGTNSGNTTGQFILRMSGIDRVFVDPSGNMGLGTGTPLAKLDVAGGVRIVRNGEAIGIDGTNPYIQFWHNGGAKFYMQQLGNNMTMSTTGANPNGRLHLYAAEVAINTSGPASGYSLSVGGEIICEELRVDLQGNAPWPDYVFADEYKLQPLNELKAFVETNKHLPNIPAASQVEEEGFDVGDMNRRLLEKVEELTLYIIQQQEEIDEMKKMVDLLINK